MSIILRDPEQLETSNVDIRIHLAINGLSRYVILFKWIAVLQSLYRGVFVLQYHAHCDHSLTFLVSQFSHVFELNMSALAWQVFERALLLVVIT